jgi:chloramphenicol 3-O phosphotransferase
VIVDDVLIDGGADQRRWAASCPGIDACWVGVHCDRETAVARESERGDRPAGIAGRYAESVHRGVVYDIEVDTGAASVDDTLAEITRALRERWGVASGLRERSPNVLPARSALASDGRRSPAPWER